MRQLDKIHLAVEDLRARGVRKSTAAPHFYRLLWRLGIAVPPPLFLSFHLTLALHGCAFGISLGALLACADRRLAPDGAILFGALGGSIFGVLTAIYFWLYARRLQLPEWAEFFPGEWADEDEGW